QPADLLQVPEPAVMVSLLEKWREQRKEARVMLVLDVSGSMKDLADPTDAGSDTKLMLAQRAAVESLDEFKSSDEVGLRVFTTGLGPQRDQSYLDILELQPMSTNLESLANKIKDQLPLNATPLYEATATAYDRMVSDYDPTRI